jgi:chromosomal replication initiation ATPase DnaA
MRPGFAGTASKLPSPLADDQIPLRQRRPWQVSLESVRKSVARESVAREFGVRVEALSRKRGGEEKMAAIYLARKLTGLSGREVSSAFGVKEARVSNVIREIEEGDRKRLRARVERLRVALLNE